MKIAMAGTVEITMPELTRNLVALEIYTHPDSVPPQLERDTWPTGSLSATGRRTVIVYLDEPRPRQVDEDAGLARIPKRWQMVH